MGETGSKVRDELAIRAAPRGAGRGQAPVEEAAGREEVLTEHPTDFNLSFVDQFGRLSIRARMRSTSAQKDRQPACSAWSSCFRASAARTPARSGSCFQCSSVSTRRRRAVGPFFRAARSRSATGSPARSPSQSRACRRSLILAASSGGGWSMPFAAAGQHRGASGVVAVFGLQVLDQSRIGCERLGKEPRRHRVQALAVGDRRRGRHARRHRPGGPRRGASRGASARVGPVAALAPAIASRDSASRVASSPARDRPRIR